MLNEKSCERKKKEKNKSKKLQVEWRKWLWCTLKTGRGYKYKDVDAKHVTHSYNVFEENEDVEKGKGKRSVHTKREVGQILITKAYCRTFYEKRSTC